MTKQIILGIWASLALTICTFALFFTCIYFNVFGWFGDIPSLKVLENPQSELASELYAADGFILGKYYRENRSPVSYEDISPQLIKTLLATEDIRFEEHSGIDLKGIFAIGFYMLKGDSRGSSTISQQLAKNLFRTRSEKYEGTLAKKNKFLKKVFIKAKEWITAIQIERAYTKKEIITMYLNTVDFGSNAYGIKTAAKTFYSTTPDKLGYEESAVLIGLLKAPTYYSPVLNPERALVRRNTVYEQLYKYNFISKSDLVSMKTKPIKLKYIVENHNQGIATYFRTIVNNFLLVWCKNRGYDLYADGLRIYTTIDPIVQQYAEKAVEKHMKYIQEQFYAHWAGKNPWIDEKGEEIPEFLMSAMRRTETYKYLIKRFTDQPDSVQYYLHKKKRMKIFSWKGEKDTLFSSMDSLNYYKRFLQAGLIAMEPETGHIKAWVGGINHKYFKYDHVKQGKRQPGSTFKPIVYTAAIDNGFHPCTKVQDIPVSFYIEDMQTTWTPQNSDGPSTGEYLTLRQALAKSINTVTAYLMKRIGPETVVDYAKRLGFKGNIEAVPALCLGISDVSIYELAGAYSTFVNHGTYIEPMFITRIEDRNGNIIEEFLPKKHEAINEETAYTMVHMLQGATSERGGTAMGLHRYPGIWSGNELGGKTGTTQNFSDGWFVGITPSLVTAIWVGGDDRSIHFRDWTFGQGARLAMPIFGLFMEDVYKNPKSGVEKGRFKRPNSYTSFDCNTYTEKQFELTDSSGFDLIQKKSSGSTSDFE